MAIVTAVDDSVYTAKPHKETKERLCDIPSAYFPAGWKIKVVHKSKSGQPVDLYIKSEDRTFVDLPGYTKFYIGDVAYRTGSGGCWIGKREVTMDLPPGTILPKESRINPKPQQSVIQVRIADNQSIKLQAGMKIYQLSNGLQITLQKKTHATLAYTQPELDVAYQLQPMFLLKISIAMSLAMILYYSEASVGFYPVFFSLVSLLVCATQYLVYDTQQDFLSVTRHPEHLVAANRVLAWMTLLLMAYWYISMIVALTQEAPFSMCMNAAFATLLLLGALHELSEKREI